MCNNEVPFKYFTEITTQNHILKCIHFLNNNYTRINNALTEL